MLLTVALRDWVTGTDLATHTFSLAGAEEKAAGAEEGRAEPSQAEESRGEARRGPIAGWNMLNFSLVVPASGASTCDNFPFGSAPLMCPAGLAGTWAFGADWG